MARSFEREFAGEVETPIGPRAGFFQSIDGAPAAGYRAPRGQVTLRPRRTAPVARAHRHATARRSWAPSWPSGTTSGCCRSRTGSSAATSG